MTGPVSTKSHKDNKTEQAQGGTPEVAHQPTSLVPQTDIFLLQDAAGNRAVSQLLQVVAGNRSLAGDAVPSIVDEVLRSPGQSLDPATRASMEIGFGHDFGQVRVHTDAKSAKSARAVNAVAYTVGNDVVFDTEYYKPDTARGYALLSHELAHVVQQRNTPNGSARIIGATDDVAEAEANRTTTALLSGVTPAPLTSVDKPILRRADDDRGWIETASDYLGKLKERAYEAMIAKMRGAQGAGLNRLRFMTKNWWLPMRVLANLIITQVENVTDLLISLVLAIVGLAVGLVSGLVKLVLGLLQFIYGIIYMVVLFFFGFFGEAWRDDFNERMNNILEGLKNIIPALQTLAHNWVAKWRTSSPDRKTLMIGELTGEIEAIIASFLVAGGAVGKGSKLVGKLGPTPAIATTSGTTIAGEGVVTIPTVAAGPPTAAAVMTGTLATSITEEAKSGSKEKGPKPSEEAPPKEPKAPRAREPVVERVSRPRRPPTEPQPPERPRRPRRRSSTEEIEEVRQQTFAEQERMIPPEPRPEGIPEATRRQAGVSLAEKHHIATRFRAENRAILESVGLHVDNDLNLIKNFPEHGQLRGWYDWQNGAYRYRMKGHHPDYNRWVTNHLRQVAPAGLTPDQALRRIVRALQRLERIIRRHPEVLQYGPRILPPRLQSLTP